MNVFKWWQHPAKLLNFLIDEPNYKEDNFISAIDPIVPINTSSHQKYIEKKTKQDPKFTQ
jgi:hypothetical protein